MLRFTGLGINILQEDKTNASPGDTVDKEGHPSRLIPCSSQLEMELSDLCDGSDDDGTEGLLALDKSDEQEEPSNLAETPYSPADLPRTPKESGPAVHDSELSTPPTSAKDASVKAYTAEAEHKHELQTKRAANLAAATMSMYNTKSKKAAVGFGWSLPSEELLPKIALVIGWRKAGAVMAAVSKQWKAILQGDALWSCFMAEEWSAHAERRGGWGGHDLTKLRISRTGTETEGKVMKEFRDRYRRRIDESLGELRTGWDWVRERIRKDELDKSELVRCSDVAKKLAKKDWVKLYDCVSLLTTEAMEDMGVELRSIEAKAGAHELLRGVVECWRCARAWIRRANTAFDRLNVHVDTENRRLEGQYASCSSKLAHTPTVYQQGLIAFRDCVVLWTGARARRLQASLRELAGEEARDLPDSELELLMAFQNMLEELDVQDDHTGGGGLRGQSKLRKMFLQPLRKIQCEKAFTSRSGKVRMFGGDRDLLYGRFAEGNQEALSKHHGLL